MKNYQVLLLNDKKVADYFILDIHYAHRKPSISYLYGLFDNDNYEKDRLIEIPELIGVCSFGMSASPNLSLIAGEENKDKVLELNRLVLKYNRKNEASYLVSQSLKLLPKPKIVVSYADTAQNHIGTVYQASNFLFTGTTKERTDIAAENGKHSRHHSGDKTNRVLRSSKHRYIYVTADKKEKKELLKKINYSFMPYPKSNV